MKLLNFLVSFCLLPIAIWAQSISSGYGKDLQVLEDAFRKNYPSLYRFNSKTAVDALFEKSLRHINSNTTEREFYKIIKSILSGMKDGHLGCSPSSNLITQFEEKDKYFPLSIYFRGNSAFVSCPYSSKIAKGVEIVEINNVKINAIRKTLFDYIVSDGKIESRKYWILNRYFGFYYNLVYGEQARYSVTCIDDRGRLFKTAVDGAVKKDIECRGATELQNPKLLDLIFLDHHIALLTIQTFAYDDLQKSGLDFVRFIDSAFNQLKKRKTTSLIIDLRGNGGGRDAYGSLLYSYLTDSPFRYYKKLETTTKILKVSEHPNLASQRPKENSFSGKVYLLINGLSFSATSEFCTVAKDHRRAVFIGEETGGTYCGNTSGSFVKTVLPFSQFSVFIPTTKYTMVTRDKGNKDRGIIPDYTIIPTIGDLIDKKDVQMNFAIELAEKNNNP